MKRISCAVYIIVLIHQICAATDKKPSKGRAQGLSDLHVNNGRFEYEVTLVERVNRNGKRHSPHKHFIKYEHSGLRTGTVYYRLAAFGRTFQFRLERDDSFVSPVLTVEHVYSDTRRLPFAGDLQHCFYRGEIQGDPNSTAVFNLCNGLRGSFVSNGERYFVGPANDGKMNTSAHFRKFHLIFRHSAVREGLSNAPSTCGLEDTNKPLPLLRGLPSHPSNESNSRKRRRRSIDDSFVETLVVADKTMVDAFDSKADLQSYIITLMGVVAQVYRDRSIGNSINIVVVKIVFLETNEPGIRISTDATNTLKSFCRWQKRVMAKEDSHPEHHDTAILLTRRNICRSAGKCDTLGLAELGTMCHPSRSCALAEDSGLSTAYTIAHELGHVFSLPHDGDNNRCTRSRGDQHLMAPSLSFDTKPWSWSNCSRDKITQFLDLGYGSCLADKPQEKTAIKYHDTLPGEIYSVDKQCQMIFGDSSSLCPFMEPCRRLWCVKMIGRRRGCSTHHMPWADGTPCAKKRWCIKGQCVKKRRLKPVDGNWGPWGPYNECTRKCGGGITFSYRKCNNPIPENGGKYCVGQRKRFKSCNSQECQKGSADFRALQCVNTHARTVSAGSKSYRATQWVPKYAGVRKEDQCKLYCRMVGTAIYFKLRDKVIDGTPCNQETNDICVDGKCLPAGCDRVLNSKKKVDKCGVCDGDNSSCRRFTGTFNETRFGYNYIFTIPVGSTDIVITQYGWKNREDSSYLALQAENGNFLLNGGMIIGIGVREFRFAGGKVWYSGSDKATEQIKIDGKLSEPIKVHVLEVGEVLPPNVHYALNQKVAEPTKFVYKWDQLGPWTQCSRLCQGQRKRRPRCVRAIDGQLVSNSRCDQRTRPSSVTEDCNISCRLRWHIQNPGKCSARCGNGYQSRTVRCMRVSSGRWDVVQDKHCPGAKPAVVVPCEGTCEGTKWVYSKWTECSKSCNNGQQTRQATCVDNFGELLIERDCRPEEKPTERRECNAFRCPWWTEGDWSSCSVTCGTGQQTRQVICKGEQGTVEDKKCDPKKKPLTTKSCDLKTTCPYWFAGKWTECSKSCDTGFKTRQVLCLSGGGLVASAVDDSQCSAHTRPVSRKECKIEDCQTKLFNFDEEKILDYYWRITLWSQCSVTCGDKPGTRYRKVECVKVKPGKQEEQEVVREQYCVSTPKPADIEECRVLPCTSWKHGSWGKCSQQCGKGFQLRVVKCAYPNWKITKDENCDLKTRPKNKRDCEIRPCVITTTASEPDRTPRPTRIKPTTTPAPTTPREIPRWREESWSECSVTCGQGERNRQVHCRLNDGQISSDCDVNTRPPSVMACILRACPVWHEEPWSECSVSCGEGQRQRSVDCRFANGQSSPGCDEKIKPPTKEVCNIRPCPYWMTEDWGKCSVTCGSGVKTRLVECSDKDISCDARTKPTSTERCELKECPQWIASPWEECSVSCGQGTRQRSVDCKSTDGKSSPGCDEKIKPPTEEACNIRPCPYWITEDWGQCSVTCGSGIKIRSVECSDEDISCDPRTKPPTTERCDLKACPQWIASPWQQCSVSCGKGQRHRSVDCKSANGLSSPGCDKKIKPATKEDCNIRPCPTWIRGDWGKCSVTCGSGVRARSVECSDEDISCDARTKPQTTERCELKECPQWIASLWGECSVSCGKGTRHRTVDCRFANGQSSRGCDENIRPAAKENCNIRPCPYWMTEDWSKCSVTCGSGVKTRLVECSDEDISCDARTKPLTTERCELETCPQWTTGSWGACSKTCGDGFKRRTVQCNGGNGRCDSNSRPQSIARCNPGLCPEWKPGSWSQCSATCGSGLKKRNVECVGLNSQCNPNSKPRTTLRCNNIPCPKWKTGEWSQCSKSCGRGKKTRSVDCVGGFNAQCDPDNKPDRMADCNHGPCPEWKVGEWQECSVTCGRGWRRRKVECVGGKFRCDYRNQPDVYTMCDMGACPVWKVGKWSQCSVSCGNGKRDRTVECTGGKDKCDRRIKPKATASCNLGSCPEWEVGDWSQCSVSCSNGQRNRIVKCSGGQGKCNAATKPEVTTSCNAGPCPVWKVGDWTQCSATCGEGSKQRSVECSRSDVSCDVNTKPPATSRCNLGSCPVWQVGQWHQCSVTCGIGSRRRAVICSGGRNKCDPKNKPQSVSQCNPGSCPEWKVGDWSECSVTCGSGSKQRTVECSRSDVTCDPTKKPTTTTRCDLGECPKWETGAWNSCSVTCGDGRKQRTVKCSAGTDKCDPRTKPQNAISCNAGSCPQWRVTKWSQCSASCDEGVKTRVVECDGAATTCDSRTKPADRESCNLGVCLHWKIGKWSECSVTCGGGYKQRQIECVSGVNASCDEKTKPAGKAKCYLGLCPRWNTGRWTPCSRTCGEGIRRRAVGCFSMKLRRLLDEPACDAKLRPPDREVCKAKECYPDARWHKGEWGKCSVYCGLGDKSRDVWCSTKSGTKVPDEYCADEHKPRTHRSCNKKRRCGEWEGGVWSECSKSCGEGTKTRAIRCLHQLEYKGDMFCDIKTRPSEKQRCNKGECPPFLNVYYWQTSTWSQCSNSCGYGKKSRDIWCVDLSRRKVSIELCNPASKPENSSLCLESKCPPKWKHGDWSACSKSCGRGYQYRPVECVAKLGRAQSSNTECDRRTKPPVWRPCNLGQCGGFLFWRVGPWSQCSVSCGSGVMKRAVKCLARNGTYLDDSHCTSPTSSKPDPRRPCHMNACPATSCKDVQLTNGVLTDGEQTLIVQGKELQVYCHAMMSEEPKEYITLKTGPSENFAEIYPKRLRDPWKCPANGSHFDKCDCENDDYKLSGGSYFSKIRINLSTMKIIAEDRQFAVTRGLNPPPYGTAGDCYSAQGKCPQGRFSINLHETGIKLTSKVMWGSTGQAYSQIIYRYPEGLQVIGKCGGRCGICSPDEVGLQVETVKEDS
ncbi:A disintegrin and metalloproteinase with thrombospondin motifs 9-like isoform X3 [Oculina patagonica]